MILVMNEKGAKSVMSSKVKLGGEASIAAGPVGRTSSAETDAAMNAEMLSWSRSKGVFGGVSLEGSTIPSDDEANKKLYGKDVNAKQIIVERDVKSPAAAQSLEQLLTSTSPRPS